MGAGDADVPGNAERASTKIAVEIAASEGVDPTELTPRLGEVVDPDAIDALFAGGGIDGELAFTYCDHRVVVRGGDEITVDVRPTATRGDAEASAGTTTDVD
ncbi:hypothetical protein BRC81_04080 [Halobacteriales archaeon QS_1_68_20]|nr:MAG: hypothetical protein BRC81_04080 [Halobacteriales archaeon QS_1_68_20]